MTTLEPPIFWSVPIIDNTITGITYIVNMFCRFIFHFAKIFLPAQLNKPLSDKSPVV